MKLLKCCHGNVHFLLEAFCEPLVLTGKSWCRGAAKGRLVHDSGGDVCDDDRVRIPLRDVIRFKERQWFIEEVEVRVQGVQVGHSWC